MDMEETIKRFAAEQNVELTKLEMDYLKACITYDWYALEPQMPYSVVEDRGLLFAELKAAVSTERLREIRMFYVHNWQSEQ